MADGFDPYKTLQVDPEADEEVIRAAYRGLARKYHPDVASNVEAAARMAAINIAWELIGEPTARERYDRSRVVLDAYTTGATSASAAPTTPPTRAPGAGPQPAPARPAPPEEVSRDWTSGRSSKGGGI